MQKHNLPNTIDSLNGAIGNEIGSGNIRFIQDVGQKVEGVPYLDKNTNKLHLCVTTTNSTDNDSNFIKFDLKESFNKLQNLIKVKFIDIQTIIVNPNSGHQWVMFEGVANYNLIGVPRERIISAQSENAVSGYLETVALFPEELSVSYIDYRDYSKAEKLRIRINLRTVSVGDQHFGNTIISIGSHSIGVLKFTISGSTPQAHYINTFERVGKKLSLVVGLILDSKANLGSEYCFVGDGSPDTPNIKDDYGFSIYHNASKPFWVSAICIFVN